MYVSVKFWHLVSLNVVALWLIIWYRNILNSYHPGPNLYWINVYVFAILIICFIIHHQPLTSWYSIIKMSSSGDNYRTNPPQINNLSIGRDHYMQPNSNKKWTCGTKKRIIVRYCHWYNKWHHAWGSKVFWFDLSETISNQSVLGVLYDG